MTAEFLAYSKYVGNDLSTPRPEFGFSGLKPGDRWCLCAGRFLQAHDEGCAPRVRLAATHAARLEIVPLRGAGYATRHGQSTDSAQLRSFGHARRSIRSSMNRLRSCGRPLHAGLAVDRVGLRLHGAFEVLRSAGDVLGREALDGEKRHVALGRRQPPFGEALVEQS